MTQLIFFIALLFFAVIGRQQWLNTPLEQRKKLIITWLCTGGICFVLLLALTGRLHWLVAAFTGLILCIAKATRFTLRSPLAKTLLMTRLLPYLKRRWQTSADTQATSTAGMNQEEALKILGLQEGATESDILYAHKRLMQKLHPDRGGNHYLAAKLNTARELLLQQMD